MFQFQFLPRGVIHKLQQRIVQLDHVFLFFLKKPQVKSLEMESKSTLEELNLEWIRHDSVIHLLGSLNHKYQFLIDLNRQWKQYLGFKASAISFFDDDRHQIFRKHIHIIPPRHLFIDMNLPPPLHYLLRSLFCNGRHHSIGVTLQSYGRIRRSLSSQVDVVCLFAHTANIMDVYVTYFSTSISRAQFWNLYEECTSKGGALVLLRQHGVLFRYRATEGLGIDEIRQIIHEYLIKDLCPLVLEYLELDDFSDLLFQ
jgi:hypothetical protein